MPPVIGSIPNQIIAENTSTGPIPFTVLDKETPGDALVVTATSSNQALVPNQNILLGLVAPNPNGMPGSPSDRTVSLTPAPGQLGVTTITLVVSDGLGSASTSFILTVSTVTGLPHIASFNPVIAKPGTTVTITGSNFDPTPANNIVWFGAVKAAVTAATANSLSVTVPAGATVGHILVTVAGSGLTAVSSTIFIPIFNSSGAIDSSSLSRADLNLATGSNPAQTIIADFDGDGKPDLVIRGRLVGTSGNANAIVSIFHNINGAGTLSANSFAPGVSLPVDPSATAIAAADLDGDGKLDLIVANDNGFISVLRNTSVPGTIDASSFAARVDFAAGLFPEFVTVADLDGDGKFDVIASNSGNGDPSTTTLSIFRNTSTRGSFNSGSLAPQFTLTSDQGPTQVVVQDLDGDGKPDMAVVNINSQTISVFRNISSAGDLSPASFGAKIDFPTGGDSSSLSVADLDGDGKPDLIVNNFSANSIGIFRNTSSAGAITTSSFAPRFDLSTGAGTGAITTADLNGDGKLDIIVSDETANTMSVFRNTAIAGNLDKSSFAARVDYAVGVSPKFLSVGDLDLDGRPDLAVPNLGDGTVTLLRNVIPQAPLLTWANPADIIYGTSLGAAQLDATANVTGTFTYDPPAGTILGAGNDQTISVTFNPTDTINFTTATAIVSLNVLKANLTATANNATRLAGAPNPTFTGTLAGIVHSDPISVTYTSAATTASPAGSYLIVPGLSDPQNRLSNYNVTINNGTLTVLEPHDGVLDPTFTIAEFYNSIHVDAVAVQSDGKLIIEGSSASSRHALYRFNTDGSLDASFASLPQAAAYAGLWVQPDDRLLVAYVSGSYQHQLRRANADGTWDTSFGTVTLDRTSQYSALGLSKVAMQNDGKLVVAGAFDQINGIPWNFGIVRLNPDGSMDQSFNVGLGIEGGGNRVSTAQSGAWHATDLAIQTDGRILLAGVFAAFNRIEQPGLVRLNVDGSVDRSFRPDHAVEGADFRYQITLQVDGKILEVRNRIAVDRLNPDGSLDTTFKPFKGGRDAGNIVLRALPNGKTVVGAEQQIGFGLDSSISLPSAMSTLFRVNPDGTFDSSFNTGPGVQVLSPNYGMEVPGNVEFLALAPNGYLIVAGNFDHVGGVPALNVARMLNTAGPPPSGISIAAQPQSQSLVEGRAVSVYPVTAGTPPFSYQWKRNGTVIPGKNNQLLIFPSFSSSDVADYSVVVSNGSGAIESAIAHLTLAQPSAGLGDGALDDSFQPLSDNDLGSPVEALAIDANQNIIVKRHLDGGYDDIIGYSELFRLKPNGSADPAFLPLGSAFVTDDLVNSLQGIERVAIQPDSKMVISARDFATGNRIIRRLNIDGSVDSSFTAAVVEGGPGPQALAIQSDGKIVAAGKFTSVNGIACGNIVRLNTLGAVDASFQAGTGLGDAAQGLDLDKDGRILIAGGFSMFNGIPRNHAVRLNVDGSLDETFLPDSSVGNLRLIHPWSAGRVLIFDQGRSWSGPIRLRRLNSDGSIDTSWTESISAGATTGYYNFIAQADGKVVIVGPTGVQGSGSRGGFARLNPDGTLDSTFDPGLGLGANHFLFDHFTWTPDWSWGQAIVQEADGSIIIGGRFSDVAGVARPGLARIKNTVGPPLIAPSIVTSPQSQIVSPGGSVTFSVTANGSQPFTYQWSFNGTPLMDGNGVSGSATAKLTISPVQVASAGIYSAVVKNIMGTAPSGNATLTTIVTPVIAWPSPAGIVYGAVLGTNQLDALATDPNTGQVVPGNFTYQPNAGTILDAGGHQNLSATFTPTDTTRYTLASASALLNVSKAPLSAMANNVSRIYGAANPALTGALIGVINNDNITVAFSTAASTASAVAAYQIVPSLFDPNGRLANYAVTLNNGTLTVSAATLTVTGNSVSRVYGAANTGFTATLSGFVNGDTAGVVTGAPVFSTSATQLSPVGSYTITPDTSGMAAQNYVFFPINGILTITPAPLSITTDNQTRIYGDPNPAFTGLITGIRNGDPITATYSTTATQGSAVGNYPIIAALQDLTGKLPNYLVTSNGAILTITRAQLLGRADDKSRIYGTANPAFTGSLNGVKNNDPLTLVYSTAANVGSFVGTYSIQISVSNPMTKLANYNVKFTPGTLTITAAPLGVTLFGPEPGVLALVNLPVQFSGSFTKSGISDHYPVVWAFQSATLPLMTAPGTTITDAIQSRSIQDNLSFPRAGLYLTSLTVSDDIGNTATADRVGNQLDYVAVIDPAAGFLSGGGFVNVTSGMIPGTPAATGKAQFGLEAHYDQETGKLRGNLEFAFKPDDDHGKTDSSVSGNNSDSARPLLHFKATGFDWLVIENGRADFKGAGTIKGQGLYGFFLSALPGNGDKSPGHLRLFIWDSKTNQTVFDNQPDASIIDPLASQTVLGGGSIVIHKPESAENKL